MNGYVEAGYGFVLGGLGAYWAWLASRNSRVKKALIPIPVENERRRPNSSNPRQGER
ncbi:hypothetical protein [Acidithrix sp. C25]|uniref:Uncharacterized protein n=1 Tax=Acidithrix ferrooxidans TaxID=1280514 RepID=A0A0D8HCI2_9ACTN|nr:hypothetical protein [Acidithrix sp. C25]KJF15675.1 hypothetical protein AXFE_34670 [Acidithrix ferrooxidans]CAG4929810.1 unnamed protein product [Acidithrix sp. C25]